ncbi:DUF4177 domain-containing protein [Gymnodinialimonas hymeniacidonis]|uniref:DUF4177 domain-containing protein n=1 Tax=Gymnodinialimonas hymeniacidonis TaxID=3126508 RepID=UPI0034C5DA9D
MPSYEYKVIPAPEKARKVRGLKGAALFAHALEEAMNELGADGWQYVRADVLPQEERAGLTSKTTTYRNLLVFQRETTSSAEDSSPIPSARSEPEPDQPEAEEDDVENLWQDAETAEETDLGGALFPHRERKGVDL